jgi:tetratricopeptide (TPR) repeat protein
VSLLGRYDEALRFTDRGLRANPTNRFLINNRLVALALGGQVDLAARYLPQLEAFEGDRQFLPFVHAGRGLVAFRLGDISRGRHFYELAIRESPISSLAANATIYWLEQELFAGTTSVEGAEKVLKKLDKLYPSDDFKVVNAPVWRARRKIVVGLMEQLAKREVVIQPRLHRELPEQHNAGHPRKRLHREWRE